MKFTKLLLSVAACLLFAVSAFAQTDTFSDADVEYLFDLPEAVWKQTIKPSTTSPNVEYVYGDRNSGHLEVRKIAIKPGELMADTISGEEQRLQFLPGYVAGKTENFDGALDGKIFNYEFIRSGRNMSGRFYFLKADDNTVYVLRFTGMSGKLRSLRNQTDSIARTFNLKKKTK
ncbi:MAG: hypothetical protein M3367_07315 [Acidobacteriota bacterium]|nr:hypothetical protein [Acidobacteriota bacterium]